MYDTYFISRNLIRLFFVILVITIGCAGQVEEKQMDSKSETNQPPPPPKSLAPGTAIIEAQVVSVTETDSDIQCKVKVHKVLRYGSSTKPIANKSELNLHISKSQTDLIKLVSEGTLNENYEFTVEQVQLLNMPSGQSQWNVLNAKRGQSEN
jgi:hypothetical protein